MNPTRHGPVFSDSNYYIYSHFKDSKPVYERTTGTVDAAKSRVDELTKRGYVGAFWSVSIITPYWY